MIRLDKMLSNMKIGTRNDIKKMIRNKMITVNDITVIKSDMKINPDTDLVKVNNEIVYYQEYYYLMLHKPDGYLSANSDYQDQTIFDLIDYQFSDLSIIGRLDKDTEGLILLTNDGSLLHKIISPKYHIPKVYLVKTEHELSKEDINLLENGKIKLDDEYIMKSKVNVLNDNFIELTIYEGKYHQVKRMIQACNNEVRYLKRLSIGPILLDDNLKIGEYRHLSVDEVNSLKNLFDINN